jgi:DNA-binding SARP family transcriptional activator
MLGAPRLEGDGRLIAIDRRKALALLAYLAVTNEPHRRDTLAALLWPDYDQTRARAAVRRALASLHKAIPGPWWDTDRETIGLNFRNHPDFEFDVNAFHSLLAECSTHGHPPADVCAACIDPLTAAITIYRGDFLTGFTLRDSPDFDDWQFDRTENLRRDLASALERLARLHAAQGNFEAAIGASRRWLSLDPLNEPAHRQLIQWFARSGERHAALRQYAECVRVLERELGVPPQEETTRLVEAIKTDQWPPAQSENAAFQAAHVPAVDSLRIGLASAPAHSPSEKTASHIERLRHGRLIGREPELERAGAVWGRVEAGEARVLLVSGEPGIGKSRLARAIINLLGASEAEVLSGQCSAESSAPYAPIAQIVRSAFAARKDLPLSHSVLANLLPLAPELASRFPDLPAHPALDPQSAQRLLFESVTTLIAAITQSSASPILLFIEDVHWADVGTLSALRHLALRTGARKLKLLILLTYRDAETDLDEAHGLRDVLLDLNREKISDHIRLSRLGRKHTGDMLGTMLAAEGEISPDFSEAIFGETEGNPFFIEEITRTLIESGSLYYAGGHWRRADMESIVLPQNVRSAILTRIRQLPEDAQEVLQLAAIVGREFDFETVRQAHGSEEAALRAALESAERAQLLQITEREGKPGYAFVHALIPFALRESSGGLRRQRMHARVAEALERQRTGEVEALAYHFGAAGMQAKALEYSRLSAKRAETLYAFSTAIRHMQIGLEMVDARADINLRIALLEELADLHFKINEGVRAIPIYLEALHLWRGLENADRWIAVRLQRKIGEAAVFMNRFADYQRFAAIARSSLEAGLALAQDQAPNLETVRLLRALSREAWYIASSADWVAAEQYARSAVRMAEQLDAPSELSSALEALSHIYSARGYYRERVTVCLQRLEISRDTRFEDYRGRVSALYELGRAYYCVGEYEAAIARAAEAERLSAAIQDVSGQVNAMTLQSQCLYPLDRWDDLVALDAKLREIQASNSFERLGVAMCFHSAVLSAVMRLRGDHEKADRLRDEAYEIMVAIGGPPEQWVRNQRF